MPSREPIRYHVAMPEPQAHELHIEMEIPGLAGRDDIDLAFPVWAPGSYLVRDFCRHIYDLEVRGATGASLASVRLDKGRWRIRTGQGKVIVRYRVFAFEVSVRTSFLDDSRAFLSGTSLFFFVEGEVDRPCLLRIVPRSGWSVTTALPGLPGHAHTFRAQSYDELVDSPVEVGPHRRLAFNIDRTRFAIAMQGQTNLSRPRLLSTLRAIATTTGSIFGGFPFARYLFIIHALPHRGGGLEHANSSTLDVAGFSFEDEKGYQSFAELAAHELFHAWNVKRIHDRALGPFDYGKENYTELLWFHEGFTEYVQGLILVRAGLLAAERYLKDLAESWGRYLGHPGRNVSSLSQLSYEAWVKQYKPADNHPNRMVSYYDKGRWAGLVLDLELNLSTGGRRGIFDLFRRLWRRHGARQRPIDAGVIRREAEDLAGRSLAGYFDRFIDGKAELPVPALLKRIGIAVVASSPFAQEKSDAIKAARLLGFSGLVFSNTGDDAVVKNVVPGSPAWRAGLTYGDAVAAVGGTRVSAATVGKRLADVAPGHEVELVFFRKDELRQVRLRMARNPERRWAFTIDPKADQARRRLRRHWLGKGG
jgi:predicted metalloprotease with PDZ domain